MKDSVQTFLQQLFCSKLQRGTSLEEKDQQDHLLNRKFGPSSSNWTFRILSPTPRKGRKLINRKSSGELKRP